MNKKAFLGICLGLVVPLLAFFVMKFIPVTAIPRRVYVDSVVTTVKGGKQTQDTVWQKVPDFQLTNQLGEPVSWKSMEGKIVVADFFFTRCPQICPQMTRNMKRLQAAVKNNNRAGSRNPDFVQFLSITVDPDHDGVEELKRYADKNNIDSRNWWLLTGPKADIYKLARTGMKLGINDTEVDTAFIHPQKLTLIDKEHVIRARRGDYGNVRLYDGLDTNDIKSIGEDIIWLTLEKEKKKKFFLADKLTLIGVVMAIVVVAIIGLTILLKKRKDL